MLYIKFRIQDQKKFHDFKKVYDHMVMVRQPDFEFEEDNISYVDWGTASQEEIDAYEDALERQKLAEEERHKKILPLYAQDFLQQMHELGIYGYELSELGKYLEYNFEVNMDALQILNLKTGLVVFSTGNYPFGGLERFTMILKAFNLIAIECFNGFTIYQLDWTSETEYETVELPKKTKRYKDGEQIHQRSIWERLNAFFKR